MSELRYSNCCYALPLGELDECEMDGETYFLGRCSRCKDGAEFHTEAEYDRMVNDPLAEPRVPHLDEGMAMGGDKYNDTMFGAGDELEHERTDD